MECSVTKPETILLYKCTRKSGTDFRTGEVDYANAMKLGQPIVVENPDPSSAGACGRGLHLCDSAIKTCNFGNAGNRPWRWFEVEVAESNVIAKDARKIRVGRIERVVRELTYQDIFGIDLNEGVKACRDEVKTWKSIPWLKPSAEIDKVALKRLFQEWLKSMKPFVREGAKLPTKIKFVTAADAAAADAAADAADDAAAAAAADAAAAAAADAAAAAAADAADAAAADAAADAWRYRYWIRYYVRPYWVLRRYARSKLIGKGAESVWEPLVEMYRMGALPIGYSQGHFVIWVPEPK
jgi:hypothetical protein